MDRKAWGEHVYSYPEVVDEFRKVEDDIQYLTRKLTLPIDSADNDNEYEFSRKDWFDFHTVYEELLVRPPLYPHLLYTGKNEFRWCVEEEYKSTCSISNSVCDIEMRIINKEEGSHLDPPDYDRPTYLYFHNRTGCRPSDNR